MATPGKPGCGHQHLLIRLFEEQNGRVFLDGDEVTEKMEPELGPDFTGEVEVECQEEDCPYFEGFKDWQSAPEPLRARIELAIDSYYGPEEQEKE